jgi:molybdopterin converting factor small subunit
MRIDVRLGSGLARVAGGPRLAVEVADGATVGDLLARVAQERPALAGGLSSALTVVRGTQVGGERVLAEGDEVAVLTPVAGGQVQACEGGQRWRLSR